MRRLFLATKDLHGPCSLLSFNENVFSFGDDPASRSLFQTHAIVVNRRYCFPWLKLLNVFVEKIGGRRRIGRISSPIMGKKHVALSKRDHRDDQGLSAFTALYRRSHSIVFQPFKGGDLPLSPLRKTSVRRQGCTLWGNEQSVFIFTNFLLFHRSINSAGYRGRLFAMSLGERRRTQWLCELRNLGSPLRDTFSNLGSSRLLQRRRGILDIGEYSRNCLRSNKSSFEVVPLYGFVNREFNSIYDRNSLIRITSWNFVSILKLQSSNKLTNIDEDFPKSRFVRK